MFTVGMMRNCDKWSDMDVVRLPDMLGKIFIEFEVMLSKAQYHHSSPSGNGDRRRHKIR